MLEDLKWSVTQENLQFFADCAQELQDPVLKKIVLKKSMKTAQHVNLKCGDPVLPEVNDRLEVRYKLLKVLCKLYMRCV